jgi:hypothetical protein
VFTSLDDLKAIVTAKQDSGEVVFGAKGRLLTTGHMAVPGEGVFYDLAFKLNETNVELTASASGISPAPLRFIVPVIARTEEIFFQANPQTVTVVKANGQRLNVKTDAAAGFEKVPKERTFNLVPGFEAIPLEVVLEAGKATKVTIEVEK